LLNHRVMLQDENIFIEINKNWYTKNYSSIFVPLQLNLNDANNEWGLGTWSKNR